MNLLTFFQHRTTLDDYFNRFAILCFATATFYGYTGSTRLSLIETGTVQASRTKREETDESLQDNELGEPTPEPIKTEADFITVYSTPSGLIEQEDYSGWKQYQAEHKLYNSLQLR